MAATFWPALGGAWVYDDALLVVRNRALQAGDLIALATQPLFGSEHSHWRPLTSLVLWLGSALAGSHGVHAVALALHAANSLAVLALARRLPGSAHTAFGAALLFALHPVQVEGVAWSAAINDPLWCACALQAVLAALRWRDRAQAHVPWVVGAWCLAALLAKENAVAALPLAAAAAAWLPTANGGAAPAVRWRRLVAALAGAMLAWWILRVAVFGDPAGGLGRAPAAPPADVLHAAAEPAYLLARHLLLLVVPFPLTPFRAVEPIATTQALLLLLAAASLALTLARSFRRIAPAGRFALALVFVPLMPTLLCARAAGAYPIADRYLCLPVLGLALLLARGARPGAARWPLALAALAAAPMSFAQTWTWRNDAALAAHGLRWSPDDPNLLAMEGDLALRDARGGSTAAFDRARSAYDAAERRAMQVSTRAPHRALAASRLGLAWCELLAHGTDGRAEPERLGAAFHRAIACDPQSAPAWVGLGVARATCGQHASAEAAFRQALALAPDHAEAWFNLGYLQHRTGQHRAARESLQEALRRDPGNAGARELLARIR